METRVAILQVVNQVSDLNRSWSSDLSTADHKASPLLQGMSYARISKNGSLPPIHPSITTQHALLITKVPQRGALKGTPSQIGKHLAPCYGFTENVHIPSPSQS
jgi:hypothetical protein